MGGGETDPSPLYTGCNGYGEEKKASEEILCSSALCAVVAADVLPERGERFTVVPFLSLLPFKGRRSITLTGPCVTLHLKKKKKDTLLICGLALIVLGDDDINSD